MACHPRCVTQHSVSSVVPSCTVEELWTWSKLFSLKLSLALIPVTPFIYISSQRLQLHNPWKKKKYLLSLLKKRKTWEKERPEIWQNDLWTFRAPCTAVKGFSAWGGLVEGRGNLKFSPHRAACAQRLLFPLCTKVPSELTASLAS